MRAYDNQSESVFTGPQTHSRNYMYKVFRPKQIYPQTITLLDLLLNFSFLYIHKHNTLKYYYNIDRNTPQLFSCLT
jgi:hypothetical protein